MIIDAHAHTFPDKIADKAVGKLAKISGISPSTDGTVSDTLERMAQWNIDKFLNLNIATSPAQQEKINTVAAENNNKYTNMISTASIHPDNPNSIDELIRIKNLKIPAIKLHPDYQEFMIDESRLFNIYQQCSELNLPIIFHSGWDCYSPNLVHALPSASLDVARQFPKLKMVLAHFGGLKMWDDVLESLAGVENIYFDTAMAASYMNSDTAMKIINKHPIENIFLGSDCPWECPEDSVNFILRLPLPDDKKEKILGTNAQIFFDL